MDLIEKWFGVAPDGGDGSLEVAWLLAIVAAVGVPLESGVLATLNRAGFAGGVLVQVLRGRGHVVQHGVAVRFGFGRRDIADGFEQPLVVEPVDPLQRGELDGLQVTPRPATVAAALNGRPRPDTRVENAGQGVQRGTAVSAHERCDDWSNPSNSYRAARRGAPGRSGRNADQTTNSGRPGPGRSDDLGRDASASRPEAPRSDAPHWVSSQPGCLPRHLGTASMPANLVDLEKTPIRTNKSGHQAASHGASRRATTPGSRHYGRSKLLIAITRRPHMHPHHRRRTAA